MRGQVICNYQHICSELNNKIHAKMELYDHIPPIEEIRDIEMDVTENVIENVTENVTDNVTDNVTKSLSHTPDTLSPLYEPNTSPSPTLPKSYVPTT